MGEEDKDEDEDEDGDEDKRESRPHAIGPDPRFNRGEMRFCGRTRVPWLESDDQRLLTYRKMGMEWKKIFELFPVGPQAQYGRAATCYKGNDLYDNMDIYILFPPMKFQGVKSRVWLSYYPTPGKRIPVPILRPASRKDSQVTTSTHFLTTRSIDPRSTTRARRSPTTSAQVKAFDTLNSNTGRT
jgi:hypothetical protein